MKYYTYQLCTRALQTIKKGIHKPQQFNYAYTIIENELDETEKVSVLGNYRHFRSQTTSKALSSDSYLSAMCMFNIFMITRLD